MIFSLRYFLFERYILSLFEQYSSQHCLLISVCKISFCGNMDKLKIRIIFEYEFSRGTNAAQAARNINNTYGPSITNERTALYWFNRFRFGNFDLAGNFEIGGPLPVLFITTS